MKLKTVEISSWSIKKGLSSEEYCSYRVQVYLQCGIRWYIEKRFSEFRNLRDELNKTRPDLRSIPFPKKRWLFNTTESFVFSRKTKLSEFLRQLVALEELPKELDPFLCISSYMEDYRRNGGRGTSIVRSAFTGDESIISDIVTIHDFELVKVLGRGSFGKVFLARLLGATHREVYAMKVLAKANVIKKNQVFKIVYYKRIYLISLVLYSKCILINDNFILIYIYIGRTYEN